MTAMTRVTRLLGIAAAVLIIVAVATTIGAVAAGYRPVVIQTGSMGDTAPAGSLVIAAPRSADEVVVDDVVVMRRPGLATVTHRVIEIETVGDGAFAITKGDANESPDATPYPLEGEQLVSRWVLPGWGGRLEALSSPTVGVGLIAIVVFVVVLGLLRRIWRTPAARPTGAQPETTRPHRGRRLVAVAMLPLVALLSAGVAWAMFSSSEVVASNDFSTAACFDPQLGSVQQGETIHAVDGLVNVPITPVNPTTSFLTLSVRSNSNEPAGSTVRGHLTGGGTVIELSRATDAAVPEPLTVAWSVVEYPCGISVQRGTASGSGASQLDIALSAIDPAASFVVVSVEGPRADTDFDGDDLHIAELTSATNLRIRTQSPTVLDPQRQISWQVVTFEDPGDIDVQQVGTTLAAGATAGTITLPAPADPASTFLITTTASASTGPDVGERAVRAHLSSPTSVALSRQVAGDAVDVHVQVVTMRDGTTVRHGTVDFTAGQANQAVTIDSVDPTRATAMSTVAVPGPSAGGSTDMVSDDTIGEASATFVITDPTTVSIRREATAAAASFGWQVIEWAGPRWWDPSYGFRQRIDATTTSAAAPDEYTLPVTIDHAALVASGLARADGDDVRLLRWDGATWTELDRVLDVESAWNTADTTLWFRTTDPIAAATTSTYWLYFGNDLAAAPAADPENVWLLTEDFESGTLGDFEDRTGGTGWYEADPWTRRIPVTVPAGATTSDLADFPLLVQLIQPDLAANAQADGSDIRFTAADGVTPLDHEIETWEPSTGRLAAWVRLPSLPSAGTTVFLYYGAPDSPDQQDVRAVWPAPARAVWHLAADPVGPAPQVDDSSPGNHDGRGTGGNRTPGVAGDALDLGGSDVLRVENLELSGAAGFTLSGWVRPDSVTDARLIAKASGPGAPVFELGTRANGAVGVRVSLDGTVVDLEAGVGSVTVGSWHHLAATWDGVSLRSFADGIEVGNVATTGQLDVDPDAPLTLGNLSTADRGVDGALDELRIDDIARSNAWVSAAASNQRTPSTFAIPGAIQSGTWLGQGSWTYRKPVVVDSSQVSADVGDFTLLVEVTDTELATGAGPGGVDLVFTDADGITRLDHVIEHYDGGAGSLTAWVRLPALTAATDTQLFLYYGNPTAADQQDAAATFGPDGDLTLPFGG